MGAPGGWRRFSPPTPSCIQTWLSLGGGSPLQSEWRPLPANHTTAFPEASLGRGSLHMESGKESSSFPPLLLDDEGMYGSQEHPGGNP